MALSILKKTKRKVPNGVIVSGIGQFTTSDTTGELTCDVGFIDSIHVSAIGAPAAAAGTATIPSTIAAPSVGATTIFHAICPVAGTIAAVKYAAKEGQAAHASIGWDWHVVNLGAAGSGTAVVVDRADTGGGNTNLTGVGGGSALTAKVAKSLTVTSTTADKTVVAGDVLEITMTKNSTATTQTEGQFIINITQASTLGAEERVYVDESAIIGTDGIMRRPTTGTLTVARAGQSVTSGLKFAFTYSGH